MTKHRLRNSIKSLFRNHIDPENEDQLKGAKREVQDEVKRIFKLIKDEHLEEDGIPLECSKKESLVKLIEDFHNEYQSLYAKYEHLTDELRKKFSGKPEQGSFSSSSDSDSDNSSTDKDSKNGHLENEFQKIINGMKQELEMVHTEVAELNQRLTITCEEKEDLNSKYLAALTKIQAAEEIIMDLKTDVEALGLQRSKLSVENVELNKQLAIAGRTEAELNQRVEDLKREKDNLILEKESAFLQIDEEQKIIDSLRTMANQQNNEKVAIEKELEAVTGELSILQQHLEHAEQQMTDISHKMEVAEEENESLKLKFSQVSNEVQQDDNRIGELIAESNQLKEKLHEREREVSSLIRTHEEYDYEFSIQLNVLQQQVKSLQHQKSDLEVQLEEKVLENSGYVIQIQTLKEEVGSITMEQERLREDKENSIMQMFQKEESFSKTEEKFRQYQRPLNGIATLSATIDAKDDAYQEIVAGIKKSVDSVMNGIENVVRNFSNECENYENRISNISHELQIAKNYVREMNKGKERLKEDKQHLVEQLHDKNEKELTLKYMVEKLKIKASKEEQEKMNLTTTVVQLQETVGELEKLMKEKDEDILELGEEKKEVIRQLCLVIDHQRSRYDYLKDVLVSMARIGQRAT